MLAPSDVFLSYPRKDQESVHALAAVLKAEGLTVWMDESNVDAFNHIHDRVASGIANSRAVLAWYSQNYATSRPCQWELSAAWLCEDGERILVVNPEPHDHHVQPRSLVNRLYVGASDFPAIARQVKSHIARFNSLIGDSVSFSQPMHYGRQLTGSNHFVGRIPKLWELHDALTRSGATMLTGTTRSIAQLRGFGGVGKSVLAEEYALRFGAAYPGGIFWLKAYGNNDDAQPMRPEDRDSARLRQISRFASQMQIPVEGKQPSEILGALTEVLASRQALDSGRRSLWIVDDLPSSTTKDKDEQDRDDLSEWLSPHASIPTLITTRDRSHRSLGKRIDVDLLSNEEAFALFETHRKLEDGERKAAQELLDALGHHALALEITASYLADQQSVSIDEFLDGLRNPSEDILEQAAELADALPLGHSPRIVATLNSTISQLGEEGRDLLYLASCIAPAPIPKELIEAVFAELYTPGSARFERMKAVKQTDRYGLSRKETFPVDALSVHTLVTRTARRYPNSKDRFARIQAVTVAALNAMLRSMFSLGAILRQSLTITHARAISARLTTSEEAALLVRVANSDLLRGDLETAYRLAHRAFEYCRAKLGEDSVETCCARSGVAMVLLVRGDSAGAREIFETIAPVFERSLPPGDSYRIGAQVGLAFAAAAQGDLLSARQLCETALFACASANGPDHSLTLHAKAALCQILHAQGDLPGAKMLQQEVSDARLRIAESSDVDRLTDEFLTAQLMIGSGEFESVAPIIEKAAKVFQQELGQDNAMTLQAKLLWVMLPSTWKDAQAARQLASELVPRFGQIYGPTSPATLQARFAEAATLLLVDQSQAAQSLLEPAVSEMERVFGQYHAVVLMAKVCLADAQHSNRDFEGACRTLNGVIPVAEARLGPAHQITLNAKHCLARCLSELGDHLRECRVWEEVAGLRESLLGEDHPEVINTKLWWAQSLNALQQYQRATELLRSVVPLAEEKLGVGHSVTLLIKGFLISWLQDLGDLAESCRYREETLAVSERALGPGNREVLEQKLPIAHIRVILKQFPLAIQLLQDMIPVAEESLGREDEITLNAKACMAHSLTRIGQAVTACRYWEDVLAVRKKHLKSSDPDFLNLKVSLTEALYYAKEYERGRDLMLETIPAAEASLGTEHQTTVTCRKWLALHLHALRQFREARTHWEKLLATWERMLGTEHPDTVITAQYLFISRWEAGEVAACRQLFVDYLEAICRREAQSLSPLERDIRSRVVEHTDWLSV
jgi:TIR domain-containing protein/tetratricopeptide repeat protein